MRYIVSWVLYGFADIFDWVGNVMNVEAAMKVSRRLFIKSEEIQGDGKGPWS